MSHETAIISVDTLRSMSSGVSLDRVMNWVMGVLLVSATVGLVLVQVGYR
jgi:hypothetical protein